MKSFYKTYISNLLLIVLVLLSNACDEPVKNEAIDALTPIKLDENAGTWKTYILASPDEIAIEAPKASNSPEYTQELTDLAKTTTNLTDEQKNAIIYWGAGSVYRWSEIARELAARYNLAPASNIEGKYPIPDPLNPLADPKFPFANPPYTARMLSYLNVAQYDALVATWHYKKLYFRKAPSKYNSGIKTSLPVSELSSFPSETAAVAEASFAVLSAMFPGEVPFLTQKLTEAKNASIWAGLNVPSDISAGAVLGKGTAVKTLARAKTDGMGAANNQSLVASQIEKAVQRGIINPWVSQETPARPPMLPNYGAVKTWNLDRETLEKIRPQLPYIVGSAEWQKELDELKSIQKNQTREQARIANYWADGAGSYTPPGHWNREASNLCLSKNYSEVATARVMALVSTSLMDAGIACWDTKYYYYTPRPQQFGVKTSVGLPNFPSYTSGHSTFSAAAAEVLSALFPEKSAELKAKAKDASNSRVYGLIHFRVDCEMGLQHGAKIGQYAINRGKADNSGY